MVYKVPKVTLFQRTAHQEALCLKRRRVAHFSYRDRIGNGAMAHIYREHVEGIGSVAVKVPRLTFWNAPFSLTAEATFLRETRMLAKLNHPNIVGLLARWQADNVWHFAMECCSYSLAEVINAMPLTKSFSFYVFREMGNALKHAHEKGISHADMKPENVLMKDDDESLIPSVKVCDFGIAEERHEVSEGEFVKGTPGYMSPERVTLESRSDPRGDMFSLGCMLYEMLGGELDFSSDSSGEIWNAALENRNALMSADEFDPEINRLLHDLVHPEGCIENGAALMSYLDDRLPWVMTEIPQAGARFAALQSSQNEAAGAANRTSSTTEVFDCNLAI